MFKATVVGIGCIGVIYSIVLEVQPKFYLREVRTMSAGEQLREQLLTGAVSAENRHCEVLFNPCEVDGVHRCLSTTRNEVSAEQCVRDPLGGCPMADDPAHEVTDASGRVYSYPERNAEKLVTAGVPATGLGETSRLDGDGGG